MSVAGPEWPGFDVGVDFSAGNVVVISPAGELDISTAPDFAAIVDAVINRGSARVVFDLTALRFIDAAGLGILERSRVEIGDRTADVRVVGASPFIYRVFEAAGLADALHVRQADPQEAGAVRRRVDARGLVQTIADAAAMSAQRDAIEDTLRHLVSIVPTVITAVDGATVTLRRLESLITSAATDDTTNDLDQFQYGAREGPCVDASMLGQQTLSDALIAEDRWPAFTHEARDRGIESVLSSPVLADNQAVGAMNLYSRTAGGFSEADQALARLFASQAGSIIALTGARNSGNGFEDRIEPALTSRDTIAQAQGVLMEREGLLPDAAHSVLRRRSVRTSTPMRDTAADVLRETQDAARPPKPSSRREQP